MFFKAVYYILILVVLALGALLVGTLVPIPGNYEIKIVQSGSMEPTIKTGALVVIKPSDVYERGDIITFGEDDADSVPTTHRIVEVRAVEGRYFFTTKGDANDDPDPREVRDSEVIGKVLFSIPYFGFLIDFARKPVGFILLVGIPAGIVILDEGVNIWREVGKMRRKKKGNVAESKENNIDT